MVDSKGASAMQRIMTVLQVLADRPVTGIDVSDLLAAVGLYGGEPDSQKDSLSRDLRHLRKVGFVIDNTAGEGEDARYMLQPGDDRVRVAFTKEQLFQLQRAAVLVGVDRLAGIATSPPGGFPEAPLIDDVRVPSVLGDVQRAVASRALVKFDYSGQPRTVHPYGLRMARRGWVLEGWEQESGRAKVFNLQRVGSVRIGVPGTASPPERSARPTLDPLRFEIDEPAQALVRVSTRFRQQVEAVLHLPLRVEPGPAADGEPTEDLHYRVTNHTNFLARVIRLDERVLLVGDAALREGLRQMLTHLADVR